MTVVAQIFIAVSVNGTPYNRRSVFLPSNVKSVQVIAPLAFDNKLLVFPSSFNITKTRGIVAFTPTMVT
jgi:hypothetical protein